MIWEAYAIGFLAWERIAQGKLSEAADYRRRFEELTEPIRDNPTVASFSIWFMGDWHRASGDLAEGPRWLRSVRDSALKMFAWVATHLEAKIDRDEANFELG